MGKDNSNKHPNPDALHNDENAVVSSTDFTGLIQSLTVEEDRVESFSDIYDIPEQEGLENHDENIKKRI